MVARTPRTAALVAAGFAGFVWCTRISNALRDDDLGAADRAATLALALSFVALAGLVAWAALRRQDLLFRTVGALTVWTAAVWAVRVVDIARSHHGVGFVLVHVVLAVTSLATCVVALREVVGDHHGFFGRHPDG